MCYGNLRNKNVTYYRQSANPNATNSELDAKVIITHSKNNSESVVDTMSDERSDSS